MSLGEDRFEEDGLGEYVLGEDGLREDGFRSTELFSEKNLKSKPPSRERKSSHPQAHADVFRPRVLTGFTVGGIPNIPLSKVTNIPVAKDQKRLQSSQSQISGSSAESGPTVPSSHSV